MDVELNHLENLANRTRHLLTAHEPHNGLRRIELWFLKRVTLCPGFHPDLYDKEQLAEQQIG